MRYPLTYSEREGIHCFTWDYQTTRDRWSHVFSTSREKRTQRDEFLVELKAFLAPYGKPGKGWNLSRYNDNCSVMTTNTELATLIRLTYS